MRMRPMIGGARAGTGLFSIAIVLLLLVALYNINIDELAGERDLLLTQSRRRLRLGWILAAAALLERASIVFVHSSMLTFVGLFCWLLADLISGEAPVLDPKSYVLARFA